MDRCWIFAGLVAIRFDAMAPMWPSYWFPSTASRIRGGHVPSGSHGGL